MISRPFEREMRNDFFLARCREALTLIEDLYIGLRSVRGAVASTRQLSQPSLVSIS